eukprot:TRINITY_DN1955_c0_g1_i2.p1 TRINITY_DN1955_c0_g1~~TRINITY_DN1955_c0_g1_i2.p1  ORF type:complete len:323 (+),score=-20.20 TRINITY_DN1955_c0_g1_i2:1097-2065(+)
MPFFQTKFKIEYNRFGPEGAKELAKGLFENRGLVQLKLGMQRLVTLIIGGDDMLDEGAIAIANVILTNHKLTRLSLGKQFINYYLVCPKDLLHTSYKKKSSFCFNEDYYRKKSADKNLVSKKLLQFHNFLASKVTPRIQRNWLRRRKRNSKCINEEPYTHTVKPWYFFGNNKQLKTRYAPTEQKNQQVPQQQTTHSHIQILVLYSKYDLPNREERFLCCWRKQIGNCIVKEPHTHSFEFWYNFRLISKNNTGYNYIGDDGAQSIADMLENNRTLTQLSLCFIFFTNNMQTIMELDVKEREKQRERQQAITCQLTQGFVCPLC